MSLVDNEVDSEVDVGLSGFWWVRLGCGGVGGYVGDGDAEHAAVDLDGELGGAAEELQGHRLGRVRRLGDLLEGGGLVEAGGVVAEEDVARGERGLVSL